MSLSSLSSLYVCTLSESLQAYTATFSSLLAVASDVKSSANSETHQHESPTTVCTQSICLIQTAPLGCQARDRQNQPQLTLANCRRPPLVGQLQMLPCAQQRHQQPINFHDISITMRECDAALKVLLFTRPNFHAKHYQ